MSISRLLFECLVCIVRWTLELTLLENSVSMNLDNKDEAITLPVDRERVEGSIKRQVSDPSLFSKAYSKSL